MLAKFPEKSMHVVRWVLALGWLLLILSLFYDPFSIWLTDSSQTWSPFRINPQTCIKVQGSCLPQVPYPLGNSLFWGLIIPTGVFAILVFGHEFWRRVCPLSFFSQLPRALGKQRRIKGKELAKIKPDSWLGKNYVYLQFAILYVGVCARILFFDSHRLSLGLLLLGTIVTAIIVGYLFAGKSWCHYFCPMGPVQTFYGEPRGLLTSIAHETQRTGITQSMCRRIGETGKEESACVACNSPCVDIDAERSYWDKINRPDHKFLYYNYVGLVIGFFLYYYLYAGNWQYLLSGAWSRQSNQLEILFNPGFYLFNTPIPIPRLVAVPLTIGLSCFLTYCLGKYLEKFYKSYRLQQNSNFTSQQLQHQIFTFCTFITFNFFFIFAGRGYINKLPVQLQYLFNVLIVLVSTLWLYRTWGRSADVYSKESLASRLRKQLAQLQLDVSRFVEGRSLESLNSDEVYVLAKILPGFTGEKRMQAYKGVLKEALEEGYVNSSSSLEVLVQMRQELGISEAEHLRAITELGIEDPDLFDPQQTRTKENQLRLQSFRQQIHGLVTGKRRRGATGLGKELLKVIKKEKSVHDVLQKDGINMVALSQEYGISAEEETKILNELDPDVNFLQRSEILLSQLESLHSTNISLENQKKNTPNQPDLLAAIDLLQSTIHDKQKLFVKGILEILEPREPGANTTQIALALASLAPQVTGDILADISLKWSEKLHPTLVKRLYQQIDFMKTFSNTTTESDLVGHLESLFYDGDSLTKAISLYLLNSVNAVRAEEQARQLLDSYLMINPLVKETAQALLKKDITTLGTLNKLLYLAGCDLFKPLKTASLLELAYQTEVKVYGANSVILDVDSYCEDILVLVKGKVEEIMAGKGTILQPVQILNQSEILAKTSQNSTLRVRDWEALLLSIEGRLFEQFFYQDRDFARKVLAQESLRLQVRL